MYLTILLYCHLVRVVSGHVTRVRISRVRFIWKVISRYYGPEEGGHSVRQILKVGERTF